MPTDGEYTEMINNCTSQWYNLNGVEGKLYTSKINGNSIFFPAAGVMLKDLALEGGSGYYWSATADLWAYKDMAYGLSFCKSGGIPHKYRYYGFTIRPVENPYTDDHPKSNDYSSYIRNRYYLNDTFDQWEGSPGRITASGLLYDYRSSKTYDIYQTITGLPAGTYKVGLKGCYRKGSYEDDYALWSAGDTEHDYALFYAISSEGRYSTPLIALGSGAVPADEAPSDVNPYFKVTLSNGLVVPKDCGAVISWSKNGYYQHYLDVEVGDDGELTIGAKKEKVIPDDWVFFGDWELIRTFDGPSQLSPPDMMTFKASKIQETSFVASWKEVSGANFYNIEVKTLDGDYEHPVYKRSVSSNSVEVTGLSPNTYYQFRVRSRNGKTAQNSVWSESILNPVKTNEAGSGPAALAVRSYDGIDGSKKLTEKNFYIYKARIINKGASYWKGKVILKEEDEPIYEWPNISLSANTLQPLEYEYYPNEYGNKALGLYYVTKGTNEERLVEDGVIFVPVSPDEPSVIDGLKLKEPITVPEELEMGSIMPVGFKVENKSGNNWTGCIYLVDNGDVVFDSDVTIRNGNTLPVEVDWTPATEGSHELSVFYSTAGKEGVYILDANGFYNPLLLEVKNEYEPLDIADACMTLVTKNCAPAQVNAGDRVYYNFRFTDKARVFATSCISIYFAQNGRKVIMEIL